MRATAVTTTTRVTAEARELGECLVHSPVALSAEESEQLQEEIRTLVSSEASGSIEAADPDLHAFCFTALLGLMSSHGTMTTVSDGAPVRKTGTTEAPLPVFPPLLWSSTPSPTLVPPAGFVAVDDEVVGNPWHGGFSCGAGDKNAMVNGVGSDSSRWSKWGEEAPAGGPGHKRCGKRKESEKTMAKGKWKAPPIVGIAGKKKSKPPVGGYYGSGNKKAAVAAAEDDVKSGDDGGGLEEKKLQYVHVRARRGQATDRHSLAERARREKINARMKLLQDLVPGCNKISGTALVLEEIINHVQTLQRQVEILSMRLAAVNPRFDLSALDGFLDAADALAMMELPTQAWVSSSEVPHTTSQEGTLWQQELQLLQHQVEVERDACIAAPRHQHQLLLQVASSTPDWERLGDVHSHHLLHCHGLAFEPSNPDPLLGNRVKTEL